MCKFKKILALMLAGTMAVSLCACSNEEKSEATKQTTNGTPICWKYLKSMQIP